ncbi:MAG: O-antigen ligase family protein [Patescibacteria group bacterium]
MLEKFLSNKEVDKSSNSFRYNYWLAALLVFFLLDILSYLGWQNSNFGSCLAIVFSLLWLWLASRRLVWGLIWLIAELIIGSFGHLFSIDWQGLVLPWRYLIFIGALGLLVIKAWQNRNYWSNQKKEILWWCLILLVLAVALLMAIIGGNDWSNIFLDMNGYWYLLLWPMFLLVKQTETNLWLKAREVLSAAVVWLGFKTCFIFFLFGHYPSYDLSLIYSWWRDTGLGEITRLSDRYYRIFSQSHIWSAAALAWGFSVLAKKILVAGSISRSWGWLLFTWFNLIVVILSLSRSLWLALLISWLFLFVYLLFKSSQIGRLWLYGLLSFCLLILSWGAVKGLAGLAVFGQSVSSSVDLSQRFNSQEAAGQSRLKLLGPLTKASYQRLWLGSGFGATVTYQTDDPRIVKSTAGGSGQITTYAFEWGYLDLLYKLGLFGLIIYLLFFVRHFNYAIFKPGRLIDFYSLGLGAVWLVLLITNLTTPYLNHPLGIGLAMVLMLFYPAGREIVYD